MRVSVMILVSLALGCATAKPKSASSASAAAPAEPGTYKRVMTAKITKHYWHADQLEPDAGKHMDVLPFFAHAVRGEEIASFLASTGKRSKPTPAAEAAELAAQTKASIGQERTVRVGPVVSEGPDVAYFTMDQLDAQGSVAAYARIYVIRLKGLDAEWAVAFTFWNAQFNELGDDIKALVGSLEVKPKP